MQKDHNFVVIKGKNNVVGKHGLLYEIFDTVNFVCLDSDLQKAQRQYVFRKLYYVDHKLKPLRYRRDVTCRRRHLIKYDGDVFTTIKIFDFADGTYYGFIPLESFIEEFKWLLD